MKKIIFMPFINDDSGKDWRAQLENNFLRVEGNALTGEINNIRSNRKSGIYSDDQAYYNALHEKKLIRQQMWISCLLTETANLFDEYLKQLSGDDLDCDKTTIVCALPEFYWCDINDNDKYKNDIDFYHKPLYLDTVRDLLTEYNALESLQPNALMRLTQKYKNLIIFAGTAMWKQINRENNKGEEIFNSLIVYADGEYKESITKHNVSGIDGFCKRVTDEKIRIVKEKIGKSKFNAAPITEFNGMKFTYDICLDFICGKADGKDVPLSTELCGAAAVDVNVLIAAGMPVSIPDRADFVREIKSNLLLRCDGLHGPFGEIVKRDDSLVTNLIEVKNKLQEE